MEYRQLGRSGLRVSTMALGTMTFGGKGAFAKVGNVDLRDAARLIDIAMEAGVNLIDTANAYSGGLSEEMLGELLAGGRRAGLLIATKVRFPMGNGPNDAGLSRHHIVAACEASLKRLRADVIDLYQVHQWDGLTPIEEFNDYFDAEFSDEEVDTVGGLVMHAFGHLPKKGEAVTLGGFTFKVVHADRRRLLQLQVKIPQTHEADGDASDD